ncbi:hypothetical protein EVAR_14024_1 [Eumeta japonica]|uniref:Uncharacterized protein n=1 Tax=Eumeta variegata TaxID=151549 RepID=A0A4C1XBB3_EUMVA|nr:hypothetical protein EVAR_14024_1 [Eumeta japonica]
MSRPVKHHTLTGQGLVVAAPAVAIRFVQCVRVSVPPPPQSRQPDLLPLDILFPPKRPRDLKFKLVTLAQYASGDNKGQADGLTCPQCHRALLHNGLLQIRNLMEKSHYHFEVLDRKARHRRVVSSCTRTVAGYICIGAERTSCADVDPRQREGVANEI